MVNKAFLELHSKLALQLSPKELVLKVIYENIKNYVWLIGCSRSQHICNTNELVFFF